MQPDTPHHVVAVRLAAGFLLCPLVIVNSLGGTGGVWGAEGGESGLPDTTRCCCWLQSPCSTQAGVLSAGLQHNHPHSRWPRYPSQELSWSLAAAAAAAHNTKKSDSGEELDGRSISSSHFHAPAEVTV